MVYFVEYDDQCSIQICVCVEGLEDEDGEGRLKVEG